jgi:hypothetical protein
MNESQESPRPKTYAIEIDLPLNIYKGIGKVLSAHAILEQVVSEIVFELMKVDYKTGRTAFPYRAASTQFTLVRSLLRLRKLKPKINVADLEAQIKDCCTVRDQLAHGVWIRQSGELRLRLTEGTYNTPQGKQFRATMPEARRPPESYFDDNREVILATVKIVQKLKKEIVSALQTVAR